MAGTFKDAPSPFRIKERHLGRTVVIEPPRCPCGREGTVAWGDTFAITHGAVGWRCERCATKEQIRHALGRVVALPGLCVRFVRAWWRLP